ncbi:MAG: TetR/AcrR family transcriptional regulator [Proteobacteria bacterium]|nr:TetR/AcrR family transcriptional regulator [Pseudomonadota bacterium]HQR02771.1 TetR/AcrR family transcriptional regulator [Rhodocyclaceae bacterium]
MNPPRAVARKPPGRPRSSESHQAILDTTLDLLAERGFTAMSVEEVAARSGTSKATIYRRWPNKLHLTVAAFERTPPLSDVDRGNVGKDLETLVNRFVELMASTPLGKAFPSLLGESAHNPELTKLIVPVFDARREPIRNAIRRGIARGELSTGTDIEFVLDAIMGPVVMRFMLSGAKPGKSYIRKAVAEAIRYHQA